MSIILLTIFINLFSREHCLIFTIYDTTKQNILSYNWNCVIYYLLIYVILMHFGTTCHFKTSLGRAIRLTLK